MKLRLVATRLVRILRTKKLLIVLESLLVDSAAIINIGVVRMLLRLLLRCRLLHVKLGGRLSARRQELEDLHLFRSCHLSHSGARGRHVVITVAVEVHFGATLLLQAMHLIARLVTMLLLLVTSMLIMMLLIALLTILLLLTIAPVLV